LLKCEDFRGTPLIAQRAALDASGKAMNLTARHRPPSCRAGGSANAWTAFLPSEQLGDFPISETAKVDGPRKTEVFARDPPVEYHGRNAVTFPYCPGWQVAGMTLPPRIEMLRRLPV
jgi:hypothetical protein